MLNDDNIIKKTATILSYSTFHNLLKDLAAQTYHRLQHVIIWDSGFDQFYLNMS